MSTAAALLDTVSCPLPAARSDAAAFEAVLDRLAPAFAGALCPGALLVVSADAGSATAVEFWRAALATGPALASPGAFPWTLANAPCGALARRYGITGANVTWLAERESAVAATLGDAALWWQQRLAAGTGERDVWVVALRFAPPKARVAVWHWRAVHADSGSNAHSAAGVTSAQMAACMAGDWTAGA